MESATRTDGRAANALRPVKMEVNYNKYAEGSVLYQSGDTAVLCTASIEDRVPIWLRGSGQGWVTAEYGMLPRATGTRNQREAARGKIGGRTQEIQRLIGRSLRSVVDLKRLGERTIWIDCDVLQADGGTRTASITGGFVALAQALEKLRLQEGWRRLPLTDYVAAVSVGVLAGIPLLDLCYEEDSHVLVDMNVVMTGQGGFVEIQGTGEGGPFSESEMNQMMALAKSGVARLVEEEKRALGSAINALIGGDSAAGTGAGNKE